mmetsp:Transcript_20466/g.53248  ORF Transcript_20466/g.53248 Transcript_20466/m.53248 type:complete len:352 (+) Transcript_20466:334-1389(+)
MPGVNVAVDENNTRSRVVGGTIKVVCGINGGPNRGPCHAINLRALVDRKFDRKVGPKRLGRHRAIARLEISKLRARLPHPLPGAPSHVRCEGRILHLANHRGVAHVEAPATVHECLGLKVGHVRVHPGIHDGTHLGDVRRGRGAWVLKPAVVNVVLHDTVERAGDRRHHVGLLIVRLCDRRTRLKGLPEDVPASCRLEQGLKSTRCTADPVDARFTIRRCGKRVLDHLLIRHKVFDCNDGRRCGDSCEDCLRVLEPEPRAERARIRPAKRDDLGVSTVLGHHVRFDKVIRVGKGLSRRQQLEMLRRQVRKRLRLAVESMLQLVYCCAHPKGVRHDGGVGRKPHGRRGPFAA